MIEYWASLEEGRLLTCCWHGSLMGRDFLWRRGLRESKFHLEDKYLIHPALALKGLSKSGAVSNRDLERELHQPVLPQLLGGEECLRTGRQIHSSGQEEEREKSKDSMKRWSREKGRGHGMRKRGSRLWSLPYFPRVLRVRESPGYRSRGRRGD